MLNNELVNPYSRSLRNHLPGWANLMEFPPDLVNFFDIAKGVGEVVLESVSRAGHALFDQVHSEGLSDYPKHPTEEVK